MKRAGREERAVRSGRKGRKGEPDRRKKGGGEPRIKNGFECQEIGKKG